MPELPEVEVVRRGLEAHILGRTCAKVAVYHPRAVRRHLAGGADFCRELTGSEVVAAHRRGKFLWLELSGNRALVGHLGMSGQLLVQDPQSAAQAHLRVQLTFSDGGSELRFIDQRTFGWLAVQIMVHRNGARVPQGVAHIALDPLHEEFDLARCVTAIRGRTAEIKRVLLNQQVVSGIGNIYADEALWRAGVHGRRVAQSLSKSAVTTVLRSAIEVMTEALAQGGTSFDALYVNVNGASGYFDRSLSAYGQQGRPCSRCSALIVRESFMNRSSHFCPRCQPPPRARAVTSR